MCLPWKRLKVWARAGWGSQDRGHWTGFSRGPWVWSACEGRKRGKVLRGKKNHKSKKQQRYSVSTLRDVNTLADKASIKIIIFVQSYIAVIFLGATLELCCQLTFPSYHPKCCLWGRLLPLELNTKSQLQQEKNLFFKVITVAKRCSEQAGYWESRSNE